MPFGITSWTTYHKRLFFFFASATLPGDSYTYNVTISVYPLIIRANQNVYSLDCVPLGRCNLQKQPLPDIFIFIQAWVENYWSGHNYVRKCLQGPNYFGPNRVR
jgi:hypothetical protein